MNDLEKLRIKGQKYFEYLAGLSYNNDNPIISALDKYDKENPGLNSFELKAAQYEILSEKIDVVVFEESPFYFLNNITWCPGLNTSVSFWLLRRNRHIYKDADPEAWRCFNEQQRLKVFLCCGPYTDTVHYTVPVENIIKRGLKSYYLAAESAKVGATESELDFLNCAQRGLLSVKRICERYADAARKKLNTLNNPEHIKNMKMLIEAASHSPWEAPSTFFEGLNACWFARNVIGNMEGIGNATLGRVDYLLYDLYNEDIKQGRLTREEAYELVKQFMVLGDMQYDKDITVCGENDHELEMGIGLGGCDRDGKPVYNELTSMFIKAASEAKCVYPKIHARFSSESPKEYLEEIVREFVSGRSTIGLSCDDGIIPALVHSGKTLEDARSYETCGCWENKVTAKESMPGGNYVYALTLLEQSVYGPEWEYVNAGLVCESLDDAQSFDDVYKILCGNLTRAIRWRCEQVGKYGKLAPLVNPYCLTSVMMDGCLESKKDYTQGGAEYNVNTADVAGFANYVDAMLVIKSLCFDEKIISLKELLALVKNNWQGGEDILSRARKCTHFCDNKKESNELANKLHRDIYNCLKGIENERGGRFVLNYYVYREFFQIAKNMRATPDGRRNGDMFAQGIGPSKYHAPDCITDIAQSVCSLDVEKCVTSALDFQLSYEKIDKEHLVALLTVLARLKVKHLQLNCVSREELLKAQKNPELYGDLVVRVTGFSAKFVSLSKEFQDELIERHVHQYS